MLAQNRIDTTGLITESVNLENFPQAFEALKKPSDQIKVMLEPFKSDAI
jgi:threonine dehydrogenase-like Zn-dependent dehydrogenase